MSHFYLTLPSNSSERYYPDNTVTKYTTRLQTTVDLSGSWEAAIVEIMFTKTWYTIPKNSGKFTFSCFNCEDFIPKQMGPGYSPLDYNVRMAVPSGYYTNMQDIIDAINAEIEEKMNYASFPILDNQGGHRYLTAIEKDKWPRFKYNPIKKKIFIHLQPGAFISFDDYLETLLGIKANPLTNRFQEAKFIGGTSACDITGGIHALYVYCDVLENVPVGDTEAPLLRIVDATGAYGANIHHVFDPPRYVPVQKKHFDSIEVDIKSDIGEPISFEGGKLMIVVHFRSAGSPFFSR
jgi:hypothetical protein